MANTPGVLPKGSWAREQLVTMLNNRKQIEKAPFPVEIEDTPDEIIIHATLDDPQLLSLYVDATDRDVLIRYQRKPVSEHDPREKQTLLFLPANVIPEKMIRTFDPPLLTIRLSKA